MCRGVRGRVELTCGTGFVYLMCKELGQELRFVEEVNQAKKNRRKPRPRVVVVTDFLLVMIKREGKTKLKVGTHATHCPLCWYSSHVAFSPLTPQQVTHTAHLLDLKKISSREPQRVELTFQRSSKPHTLILLTRLVKVRVVVLPQTHSGVPHASPSAA